MKKLLLIIIGFTTKNTFCLSRSAGKASSAASASATSATPVSSAPLAA
jgi:hypothetical protein